MSRSPVFAAVYGLYVNRQCRSFTQFRHRRTALVIGPMDRKRWALVVGPQPLRSRHTQKRSGQGWEEGRPFQGGAAMTWPWRATSMRLSNRNSRTRSELHAISQAVIRFGPQGPRPADFGSPSLTASDSLPIIRLYDSSPDSNADPRCRRVCRPGHATAGGHDRRR